jgi:hypothetical protein
MRTKVLLGLAVAVMLVVSVATIGSNMGFKISIPLYANVSGHTGFNWVALPYYVSFTDGASVWNDLNAAYGGGQEGLIEVNQYQESNGTYKVYNADTFTDTFQITSGGSLISANALLIKVPSNSNWIVVGSHNPSLAVPLYALGAGHTGLNWRAVPYHSTASTGATLWNQLNTLAGGGQEGLLEINQYQESNGTYKVYNADTFTDSFNLVPGQSLLVKVASPLNWTPAHY